MLHILTFVLCLAQAFASSTAVSRRLYAAVDRGYGAHVYIYDIDNGHRLTDSFVIPGMATIRGISGSSATSRLYISADGEIAAYDLVSKRILWRKKVTEFGDRAEVTLDGRYLLMPTGWRTQDNRILVLDAGNGEILQRITLAPQTHNVLMSRNSPRAYVGSLASPYLYVLNTSVFPFPIEKVIGPFTSNVRPFVVNAAEDRVFANVDFLLGFEIADLNTGRVTARLSLDGYPRRKPKKHKPCPSHGIAMAPDESEIWVVNNPYRKVHVFDNRGSRPRLTHTLDVSGYPGWITFSNDGTYAYPSTGDVIEARAKEVVTTLIDENGERIESEKMLEVDFAGDQPLLVGSQYGVGRAPTTALSVPQATAPRLERTAAAQAR